MMLPRRFVFNETIKLKENMQTIDFRKLFIGSSIAMLLVMLFFSHDYGISWDEQLHKEYGEKALNYYQTFGKDTSCLHFGNLYMYGAFFDMTAAALNKMHLGDEYEVRHTLSAFFGFIAILCCGLLAMELAGWRAGFIALLLLFFSPRFFGDSMYNPKDIPFAALFTLSIYAMIRVIKQFPKPTFRTVLGLIVSIALTTGIRVGGLLLFFFFGLLLLGKVIATLNKQELTRETVASFRRMALLFVVICASAYLLCGLCWPFALTNPLMNPFRAFQLFSAYDSFNSYNLFEGRWINVWEIPWNYIPKWIWITTPIGVLFTFLLMPLLLLPDLRNRLQVPANYLLVIAFMIVFPILFVIFKNSNVYDSYRHLYFVYPLIVACSGVLWNALLSIDLKPVVHRALLLILALALLEPAVFMVKNRGLQQFYFSPVIGGNKGAFKHYEIDYYGTSIRQAVEWIAANTDSTKPNPIRVRNVYGELISVEHFVKKYKHLQLVFQPDLSLDWDYSIVLTAAAKHDSLLLVNWPPPNTVHEIMSGGTPLLAIVANGAQANPAAALDNIRQQIRSTKDPVLLINSSLSLFNSGDFFGSIEACERALQVDPTNVTALSNITAALNNLSLFEEAIPFGEKAVKLNPTFTLAAANLALSRKNKDVKINPTILANQLINLSVVYHNTGQFERCIDICKKSLALVPDNAIAYNNICSSFNGLGRYAEAEVAGAKAVTLSPEQSLFKNNLAFARSKLGK